MRLRKSEKWWSSRTIFKRISDRNADYGRTNVPVFRPRARPSHLAEIANPKGLPLNSSVYVLPAHQPDKRWNTSTFLDYKPTHLLMLSLAMQC
jgi:hypothetical protein